MFSNQTFIYTLFILCQEEIIPLHTPYPHFRIFCSKNACLWIFQLKVLDISKNFVQRFSTFVQKIKKYRDVFHKTCPGFLQSTCSIYKKI